MEWLYLAKMEWTLDGILHKAQPYLLKAAWGIAVLVVGLFLVKVLNRVLKKVLAHTNLDDTARDFSQNVIRITAKVFVCVIALSAVGVDIGPLIAGIGVAGFVVGFALKDTLSNLAAGIMLLFYRPFEKGDIVEVLGGKIKGSVESIDVPATLFKSLKGEQVMVPNSKIWGDIIVNHTRGGTKPE